MRIPQTPIIVDEFKFVPGVYVYLLTHLHSDHTSGLTPSWNYGTIYCSHITKVMLHEKFRVNESVVVALEEDETHNIPLDLDGKETMQVTLIDANHCPGACMFLLEGYFGHILHTGDFRFDPLILQHPALLEYTNSHKILDQLYLDDTFLDPDYEFPSRAIAGQQVLEIIEKSGDYKTIVIGMDTLGKEELLVAIAVRFRTLIVVDEERLTMVKILQKAVNIPDVFTNDEKQGRVIICKKKELYNKMRLLRGMGRQVIGIIPSGWSVAAMAQTKQNSWIHRVAYSLHSAFSELESFVKALKPTQLYSASKHDNIHLQNVFGKYCSPNTEKSQEINIPRSVKFSMESKSFNKSAASPNAPLSKASLLTKKSPGSTPPKAKGLKIAEPDQTSRNIILDITDEKQERIIHVIEESNEEKVSLGKDQLFSENIDDLKILLEELNQQDNPSDEKISEEVQSQSLESALHFIQNLEPTAIMDSTQSKVQQQDPAVVDLVSNILSYRPKDHYYYEASQRIIHTNSQNSPVLSQGFNGTLDKLSDESQEQGHISPLPPYKRKMSSDANRNFKRPRTDEPTKPPRASDINSTQYLLNMSLSLNGFDDAAESPLPSRPIAVLEQQQQQQQRQAVPSSSVMIDEVSPVSNVFVGASQEDSQIDVFSMIEGS